MTYEPFVKAETEYRLARVAALYDRSTAEERYRRVPRRRPLRLPHPRRRPLRLA